MDKKEQAIMKGKLDALIAPFIKIKMEHPEKWTAKMQQSWLTLTELSVAFDKAAAAVNYYQQAALERDDKFWLMFEENAALKLQIEQLKEARDKAVKDWEEQE